MHSLHLQWKSQGELSSSNMKDATSDRSVGFLNKNILTNIQFKKEMKKEAAKSAVDTVSKTVRDLRVAEINKLDMKIENGKVTAYRARVNVSFKYEDK